MEVEERVEEVVIVGEGIAGLATAMGLRRVGKKALVLERSEELRATGAALSLFPNAWRALDALGVAHKLTSVYHPLSKGYITNVSNGSIQEVTFSGTDRSGGGPITVHRKALVEALAEELPPNTIRFSSKLTSIQLQHPDSSSSSSIVVLTLDDGTKIKTKVLIGCDGVHSVVGRWLGLAEPVFSGRCAVRGLAVFPKGHGLRHEVRQFVDGGKRAGFAPLNDREVYWFLVYKSSFEEDMARNPELIKREVIEKQAKNFPPMFLDVVDHTDLSILTCAPLMLRYPWNVAMGNFSKGPIVVAGDAMHPMTPDLGQGGGSALEDAVVLVRHLANSVNANEGVDKAMERYAKERRWRVTWLIAGSYISGWVQEAGSGWVTKFIRDVIFYKFLYRRIMGFTQYDCGQLSTVYP
ncbi:hypothetical protein NMG60_11017044 [Bertholletia excelsa]